MLNEHRRWAEEEDLSPDVIENIYKYLIDYFVDRGMTRWQKPK